MIVPRIGEILMSRGLLSAVQIDEILAVQCNRREPFGLLAEEMFNITCEQLESAWAEQYSCITAKIDPRTERIDREVTQTLSRRQAWQFRVMPIRYDGAEVMVCTDKAHLPRALRFAYQHFGAACYIVLADPTELDEALSEHYPMPSVERIGSTLAA